MRIHRRFLILWIIFIFSTAVLPLSSAEENLAAIVKRIEPSVVVILTYDKEGKILDQGSGFFISENGDVITNRHVLQGASRAEVTIANGRDYPITQVMAEDKDGDLIRVSVDIPRDAVCPLVISDSIPEVGEKVLVIGSPLGLEYTVTDGLISAIREIPGFGKIIQISAPVSSGSSGSPVVNMKGEVIGVVSFQMVKGQNLNFAIPGKRVTELTLTKGITLVNWNLVNRLMSKSQARELYSTGLTFLWIEDYEGALPYFEQAVQKNPEYADAYSKIGYCNHRLGCHKEAIELYKQAIRIDPDHAEAHYNLGVAYGNLRYFRKAIEAFKQAIRVDPDHAETHFKLGVAYGALEYFREGTKAFKQAIRIDPDHAEAHYFLGRDYLILGDRGSALDQYKILKNLDSDLANELFNLIYE